MDNYVVRVLEVASSYFPCCHENNFPHLFKLSAHQVAIHLKSSDDLIIRNFLMLLFWTRNYPPFRTVAALFGLSKTHANRVINELVDAYASKIDECISLNNVTGALPNYFINNVVGIVDGTEVIIQKWV